MLFAPTLQGVTHVSAVMVTRVTDNSVPILTNVHPQPRCRIALPTRSVPIPQAQPSVSARLAIQEMDIQNAKM